MTHTCPQLPTPYLCECGRWVHVRYPKGADWLI